MTFSRDLDAPNAIPRFPSSFESSSVRGGFDCYGVQSGK